MSVGVLLITHEGLGFRLRHVGQRLLGRLPLQVEVFEVDFEADPEVLLPDASAALRRVDDGHGVLLLTDVYGATPSNLAARLTQLGTPCRRVAGLNLPMLLRVLNYSDQALDELALTAAGGGRNGIVLDHA